MSRRLPVLACAAAIALALTACTAPRTETVPSADTASSAAAPSSTPAPASSAAPMPTPSASVSANATQQGYLGFVSQFSPTLAATPQSTLLALGEQVCAGFRSGQDATAVSSALGRSTLAPDLEATDAAVILGAAVAQLCPQYRGALAG